MTSFGQNGHQAPGTGHRDKAPRSRLARLARFYTLHVPVVPVRRRGSRTVLARTWVLCMRLCFSLRISATCLQKCVNTLGWRLCSVLCGTPTWKAFVTSQCFAQLAAPFRNAPFRKCNIRRPRRRHRAYKSGALRGNKRLALCVHLQLRMRKSSRSLILRPNSISKRNHFMKKDKEQFLHMGTSPPRRPDRAAHSSTKEETGESGCHGH